MIIKKVSVKDAKELRAIYTPYVKETAITFEYRVPSLDEFEQQIRTVTKRYPYLKAVDEHTGEILGYTYASAFKGKDANDWSVETTIYVKQEERGKGIGRALYDELEMQLKLMGILNANACIAIPKDETDEYLDEGSWRFYQKMGYRKVGVLQNNSFKFDKWYDLLWMEKILGKHDEHPEEVRWMKTRQPKGLLERRLVNILVFLIIATSLSAVGAYYYFYHLYSMSNYVGEKDYTLQESIEPETYYDENGNVVVVEEATLDPKSEEELIAQQQIALKELALINPDFEKGIYNMLLIGVDRYNNEEWNGNSDVMVLVTVNDYTKTIFMTSFLRDLYANIPEVGVRKLNAACAYGGPQLLVETIKSNYGVQIDNWAIVDFSSMRQVIDACGGIYLDVSEEEGAVANQYIDVMCRTEGENPAMHKFYYGGWQHLDGYMAVGYARNRYTGTTNDFGRTERQRKVLNALIRQMGTGSITTITKNINDALPYVTHDVTQTTLASLMTKVPTWLGYQIVQQHIPYDDDWTSQNEILVPSDIEGTIRRLTSTIYAGKPLGETETEEVTE